MILGLVAGLLIGALTGVNPLALGLALMFAGRFIGSTLSDTAAPRREENSTSAPLDYSTALQGQVERPVHQLGSRTWRQRVQGAASRGSDSQLLP